MHKNDAVIVAYGRTACSRARKGPFAQMHPIDYSAQALRGVLNMLPTVSPEKIDDIIVGCAMPVNQLNMNAARLIALRAGLPYGITAQTINRLCSSSLQAIATGANAIFAGQMNCVIAGGVEDMTHCFEPYPDVYHNAWLQEHIEGAYMSMGETAEIVAELYGITREMMDQMAVDSHAKAIAAQKRGKLAASIIPVTTPDGEVVAEDDGIRPETTMESISGLKTPFRPENGRVTAATSSQTTDAAAFVALTSAGLAAELDLKPIARLVGFQVAGCDPAYMGMGPVYAVPKVMQKTGLTIGDMDVIELNEAFASQALACIRELRLPAEKVNPYGGAMALGHPMGATGAFLTIKALDYLEDNDGRYGLVTMCIGGGMGAAAIFERVREVRNG